MENLTETPDTTKLPATLRAEMLSNEKSMFFNVALFEHGQRIADMFAKSTMVPEQFRNNVGNCMIALNYASRIQADPFMMMQCMYVVYGKPGIEGKLVAALINQSGKYSEPLQYQWFDNESKETESSKVVLNTNKDDRGCRAHTVDAKSNKPVFGPLISWKIIHDEGWFTDKPRKGGGTIKSKWKTFPELMFMYRAASWFANINCPEVKLGMHTVEELKDIVDLHPSVNGSYTTDAAQDLTKAIQDNVQSLEELKEKPEDKEYPELKGATDEEKAMYRRIEKDFLCKHCKTFTTESLRGLRKHITQSHKNDPETVSGTPGTQTEIQKGETTGEDDFNEEAEKAAKIKAIKQGYPDFLIQAQESLNLVTYQLEQLNLDTLQLVLDKCKELADDKPF